jgi:SAM-dependent methyltransferase/3-polyprenyl-4-hydroxybenzoate decarboxylase
MDDKTLRRARTVRIYDVADRMVVLGARGDGHELHGATAELARAVLAFFEHARPSAELLPHLELLSGGPIEHPQVVHDLVRLLLEAGALERGAMPSPEPIRRHGPSRVLLGLTGAVGSMHAPALVTALQQRGFVVRIAATTSALRFVAVDALEALTHHRVVSSSWPTDTQMPVPHINLAQWADAVVICPASATTISRLATADHDNVVAAAALATRAPVMVVPSMNPEMYASPGVQRNLAQLAADGMHVVHPGRGLEMADAPDARAPLLGAAPPHAIVVQLLEAVLRRATTRARPRTGDDWDAVYGVNEPPWQSATIDDDIAKAIDGAPRSLLDIGTGLGTIAIAYARRGWRVVATDLSPVALQRARARSGDASIVWLEDDITTSKLQSSFDVVIDRGCLHLLQRDQAVAYAQSVRRLTAPAGLLVVKTLARGVAEPRGATAFEREDVHALFGDAFVLEHESTSTLPGPTEAPAARLFVLRRNA